MYFALKHSHSLIATIVLLLFAIRFYWKLTNSNQLQKKWVKIVPHIFDTLLLLLGFLLLAQQSWLIPPWLELKFIGILIYIVAGFYTFKFAQTKQVVLLSGIIALSSLFSVMTLAYVN